MRDAKLPAMQRALTGGPGVLHVYHPLGFPTPHTDRAYLESAIYNGAGVLELGLPFSDPSADGPVLQDAAATALRNGATVKSALATCAALRRDHPTIGLVVMAYANALHSLGWDAAAAALAKAGAQGVIVPDMPLREARRVAPIFARHGVAWIPLAASTVPDATVSELVASRPPFVYAASLGVTGGDGPDAAALATITRLRRLAPDVPVAGGFGVRTPEHARRLRAAGAHGVIVGSALVRAIQDGADAAAYGRLVRGLAEATQ